MIVSGRLGIVKKMRNEKVSETSKVNILKAKNKLRSLVSIVGLMSSVKKRNHEELQTKLGLSPTCKSLTGNKLVRQNSEISLLYEADAFHDVDMRTRKIIEKYGKLLDIAGYGDIIGEFALVNDNCRTASVIAVEDSHLMVFRKECFELVKSTYTGEFTERKNLIRRVFPSISTLPDCERLNRIGRLFKPCTASLVELCYSLESYAISRRISRKISVHSQRRYFTCDSRSMPDI